MANTECYHELRNAFKARGITQADIAKRIGKSPAYIYSRMAGLEPWAQSEMYSLLDMIHEPYRKMHIYFPLGGIWAGPAEDPPLSTEQQIAALLCKMVREGATA